MARPQGGELAAGLLTLALLAGALGAGDTRREAAMSVGCAEPSEARSREGHTTAVRCSGSRPEPVRGPARLLFALPIDLNQADAATLAALPGIGPGRAEAIVHTRMLRPFRSVSDLARVPGIGGGTITRVAPNVVADSEVRHANPEKTHGLSPSGR